MRKKDVISLLNKSREDLKKIKIDYKKALLSKNVPDFLKISIKNFLENLRSALDYIARDIYEIKIKPKSKVEIKRVYFPYGKNSNDFKSRIGSCLPNLKKIDNRIYTLIESIQSYKKDDWLYKFCNITNIKKHNLLVPQERIEENETFLGRAVRVKGGKVAMKDCLINNIPVNSKNINEEPLKNFDPRLNPKRIIWVNFKFKNTDIKVLPFLQKILSEIESFSEKIYSYL
jgi:hypothetical protein